MNKTELRKELFHIGSLVDDLWYSGKKDDAQTWIKKADELLQLYVDEQSRERDKKVANAQRKLTLKQVFKDDKFKIAYFEQPALVIFTDEWKSKQEENKCTCGGFPDCICNQQK